MRSLPPPGCRPENIPSIRVSDKIAEGGELRADDQAAGDGIQNISEDNRYPQRHWQPL